MQHAKRTKKKSRIALAATAALVLLGGAAAGAGALETGAGGAGSAPPPEIIGAGSPDAVDGEYIVVMKRSGKGAAGSSALRSAASVRGLAGELLEENDAGSADVERTYGTALKGFTVEATAQQARRLAADPSVAYVEQNRVEKGDETQTDAPWALDRVDQRALPLSGSYTYDTGASNVTAYIIGTGVRLSHDEFGGRATSGHDFVDDDATATDCHGHGTHVAGIVAGSTHGVAKSADVVAVRVLNCDNRGTTADVLSGYDWVAEHAVAPAVANVSIGGSASDVKDEAVRGMVDAGVTVAVSAGNDSRDACLQSPAREPSMLTVAATTDTDARAGFSNYGDCVDLFAPGAAVVSAGLDSDSDLTTMSGTSMAAPHVTGAAALYLAENPSASPSQVTDALLNATSVDQVTGAGSGSPNKLLYSRF